MSLATAALLATAAAQGASTHQSIKSRQELKKKEKKAEKLAAIPGAKPTAGMTDTGSLLERKGRRSTKKVGPNVLGGRSLLG